MFDLTHKTVLVTGASSGIGRQTCRQLAEVGAVVVATARNQERLEQCLAEMQGEGHSIIVGDLCQYNFIDQLARTVPALDGVVHCAGIIKPQPIKFVQPEHIEAVFAINYSAPVLLTARLARLKKLKESCSLVFLSSVSSQHPYRGGSLYVSSKAALEAFCRSAALELGVSKIRANCLSPAMVKTPIFDQTAEAYTEAELAQQEKQYLLGFGEPSDVANAVAFLLSDASRWITGSNIVMDGGLILNSKIN